jgi:hypothetical protein
MIFGTFFLAIGIFLLLSALGIVTGTMWNYFWAFLFIAIGFKLLFRKKDYRGDFMSYHKHSGRCQNNKEDNSVKGEYKETD